MGESIISVRKVVDTGESFVGGPQRSPQQQGREIGIWRGRRVGTGGERKGALPESQNRRFVLRTLFLGTAFVTETGFSLTFRH